MKIVTFLSASGKAGVLYPTEDARLPGETDDALAARFVAFSSALVGATNVQIIDAATYVPPVPAVVLKTFTSDALATLLVTKGVIAASDVTALKK